MSQPPLIDAAVLATHREVRMDLSMWAPTVHELVCERIAALVEANGTFNHPTETAEEYAQRVLACNQRPFPPGTSIYDDLNNNRGYDWVQMGYGVGGEGGRVEFTGWWPEFHEGSRGFDINLVSIHCPAWVVSGPDGVDRFRAETAEMCAEVRRENAERAASISRLIEQYRGTP